MADPGARLPNQVNKAPIVELLGVEPLADKSEPGWFQARYQAAPAFANGRGMIQGGMLAAMLDNAMSVALIQTLAEDDFFSSLEIKVSFVAPAQEGSLVGEGRVLRRGRSIAFLEGELRDGDGKLIATATSTASIRKRSPG